MLSSDHQQSCSRLHLTSSGCHQAPFGVRLFALRGRTSDEEYPNAWAFTYVPAGGRKGGTMGKRGFGKIACLVAVFCVATAIASPAQTFATLASFDGTNGDTPYLGSLVQGIDGNFYGTTTYGGKHFSTNGGYGTIFRITPDGTLTTLHEFCAKANCTDGAWPYAGLVQAANGNFYGTTSRGGTGVGSSTAISFGGTVFEITPGGKFTTLYNFCSQTNCADGAQPFAGLVQGTHGNLYGTTYFGGTGWESDLCFDFCGTAFEISTSGEFTSLYSFCTQENCPDGYYPSSALLLASDGNLYGTTFGGSIFRMNPEGKVGVLWAPSKNFNDPEPNSLILGSDGSFYGTTYEGGSLSNGTVFRFTIPGRVWTTLYSFCSQANCADGLHPKGGLVQGSDGNLYGMTWQGGTGSDSECDALYGCGTLFQITTTGTLTALYNFCSAMNCVDGSRPEGVLVQGTDGTFYGTASAGGNTDCAGAFGIPGCGGVFNFSMGLGPLVEANPNFGKVGRVINILGNNLTGTTSVSFNGTPAAFDAVSDTYIKATVPMGATTGTIEVTTTSGTLSSNVAFQVKP